MTRARIATWWFVVAGACSACAPGDTAPPVDQDAPRNLLLITVDTLRADRLGFGGYARPTSPALDAWAAQSVVFENAQAHTSWTLPSLATLCTSTYSATHGCTRINQPLDPSFVTLAERLQQAGFATAAATSHIFFGRRYGMDQGYDSFDETLLDAVRPRDEDLDVDVSRDDWREQRARLSELITSPALSDKGIRLLRSMARQEQRWFVALHYFDPHATYQFHEGLSSAFGTGGPGDKYDGEIAFTDRHVGRVLDELERLGMADDTLVVLTADHGEEFGEHDGAGHRQTLYGEVVGVPLVMHVPDVTPRRVPSVVRLVDVMPTVLDVLGLPAAPAAEGVSLRGAWTGEPIEDLPALGELSQRGRYVLHSLTEGRWKLILDRAGSNGRTSTGPLDTTRLDANDPVALLFDLEQDPGETNDVSGEHPDVVQRMTASIDRLVERATARREVGELDTGLELSEEELDQLRALGYAE